MRKLTRGTTAPACLALYDPSVNWNPSDDEKDEIWHELHAMQGNLCAYCEADIFGSNPALKKKPRRIEHFASRENCPEHTYSWENLFGSCTRIASCDKYKDRVGAEPYDWKDLIKPDVDDPDQFLLFVADGSIIPRPDLSPADQHRAKETLRVFNLDAEFGELRKERKNAVAGQLDSFHEIYKMWQEEPDLLNLDEELENLRNQAKNLPFCTAIRHALTSMQTG